MIGKWKYVISQYQIDLMIQLMQVEVDDIDQARVIITMKNNHINSLQSTINKLNIKQKIKTTELTALLQITQGKLKDALIREGRERKNRAEVERQLERKEEEYHSKTVEMGRAVEELAGIRKYFDSQQILRNLKVDSLDTLPSYLQVYQMNLAMHAVAHDKERAALQIQQLRQQLSELQKRLQVNQEQRSTLSSQNNALSEQLQQKQQLLSQIKGELERERDLLECFKEEAAHQIGQLHQQLLDQQEMKEDLTQRPFQKGQGMNEDMVVEKEPLNCQQQSNRVSRLEQEIRGLTTQLANSSERIEELEELESARQTKEQSQIETLSSQIEQLVNEINSLTIENQQLQEQKVQLWEQNQLIQQELAQNRLQLEVFSQVKQEKEENEVRYEQQLAQITTEMSALQQLVQQEAEQQQQHQRVAQRSSLQLDRKIPTQASRVASLGNSPKGPFNFTQNQEEEQEGACALSYQGDECMNWPDMYDAILHKHNVFVRTVKQKLARLAHTPQL